MYTPLYMCSDEYWLGHAILANSISKVKLGQEMAGGYNSIDVEIKVK